MYDTTTRSNPGVTPAVAAMMQRMRANQPAQPALQNSGAQAPAVMPVQTLQTDAPALNRMAQTQMGQPVQQPPNPAMFQNRMAQMGAQPVQPVQPVQPLQGQGMERFTPQMRQRLSAFRR